MLANEEEQLWREVLVKLARIEEQTKGLDDITKDVSRALAISKENQKNITKLEANNKWAVDQSESPSQDSVSLTAG